MSSPLTRAVEHHRAGRFDAAEQLYTQLHRANPGDAEVIYHLGLLCCDLGLVDAACTFLEQALIIVPAFPAARAQLALVFKELGRAALAQGDAKTAESRLAAALGAGCDDPDATNWLGLAQLQLGKFSAAEASLRATLERAPGNNQARNNLGLALQGQGRHAAARGCFAAALALDPAYASARLNLADALRIGGELAAAREALETVLAVQPDSVTALNNLGAVAQDQGDAALALACLARAATLEPGNVRVRWNLALTQLALGDFANGWRNFESRWEGCAHLQGGYAMPRERAWQGDALHGKRVVLWAEQGFGDTLQFIRFARDIDAQGAHVIAVVPPQLAELVGRVAGVSEVLAPGQALPDYDLHCPLMSLPHQLGVSLDATALHGQAPYVFAAPERMRAWQARLDSVSEPTGGTLRVGLAWAGSARRGHADLAAIDARRSLRPEHLAPLLAVPGWHFFSLQKDLGNGASRLPSIDDFSAEWPDFSATAAFIACLDLVISVDTAVAHLAAALGKPVWLLNRYDACWRWLRGRDDSPWYATLRQFRQPTPGAWEPPIAAAAAALAAAHRGAAQPGR